MRELLRTKFRISVSFNQGFHATKQDGRLLDQMQDLPISLKKGLDQGQRHPVDFSH